jgi:hypothetical protein
VTGTACRRIREVAPGSEVFLAREDRWRLFEPRGPVPRGDGGTDDRNWLSRSADFDRPLAALRSSRRARLAVKATLDLTLKRKDLVRKITERANGCQVDWAIKREGGNHTVYRLGSLIIPIPRHNEIGDRLAVEIFKQCASELGEGWWK